MIAIITGVALWLFVLFSYFIHLDIGSNATIALLSIGSFFIASYAIETFKLSADGVEFRTRERPEEPQINYIIPLAPEELALIGG